MPRKRNGFTDGEYTGAGDCKRCRGTGRISIVSVLTPGGVRTGKCPDCDGSGVNQSGQEEPDY